MIDGWVVVTAAFAYVSFLFAVAYYGDKQAARSQMRPRPNTYALSLAVYCTSWTFFGSVGLAVTTGFDFLAVYLGPILVFTLGAPLIRRIIELSKAQNITSIADFIAARYGKNPKVAAIVTVIAVAGIVPYIALQLKAVSLSVTTLLGPSSASGVFSSLPFSDVGFIVAALLAVFTILFGTRHIEATEHQHGMMLAVAVESAVKIAAFILVGGFITFYMMGGIGPLMERIEVRQDVQTLFQGINGEMLITVTILSACAILLLPRQFHVAIVENNSLDELKRASWLFPLYLIGINLFVVPIAAAGILTFGHNWGNTDMLVLTLPIAEGSQMITLIAFLGGLSAATAMVIVDSVALSIMVCNDLVMPFLLRRRVGRLTERPNMGALLLHVRRGAIIVIIGLAYLFYAAMGDSEGLARIGLMSFAAIAQFAPAFFGGLMWKQATARGAVAGILAGFAVWTYTLLLPFGVNAGLLPQYLIESGPFGLSFLHPQKLFYTDFSPLTHSLFWSMTANIFCYVFVSLMRRPEPIERLQANIFVGADSESGTRRVFRPWRATVTVGELMDTVARYLGRERMEQSFRDYALRKGLALHAAAAADREFVSFAEKLLASAIGAASARLVMGVALRQSNVGMQSALRLLDDATEAVQFNRELLETTLAQIGQGIAVFDRDVRLIFWNNQFRDILRLPPELLNYGTPLDKIVLHTVRRSDTASRLLEHMVPGKYDPEASKLLLARAQDDLVRDRLRRYRESREPFKERLDNSRRVIEIRTSAMPHGGLAATYTDITESVHVADQLARANESLERRVARRTFELTEVNRALSEAKAKADEANLDKTKFLAAASHDLLQPLNAARLYTTSLSEHRLHDEPKRLVRNIDASLSAVEEILSALLDISRLDAGAIPPQLDSFPINDLLRQLELEFAGVAQEHNLKLTVIPCSLYVHSDRRLLRRLLQNLVSNAIKYTPQGRVLLGCRRRGAAIRIEVHDSGQGIPKQKQKLIFKEFQRIDPVKGGPRGLGLGLSIVERIGKVLDHSIGVSSRLGHGSTFTVLVPVSNARPAVVSLPSEVTRFSSSSLRDCVVLCIDNEPAILDGMATLLGGWGCAVLRAADAAEATSVIASARIAPDIILADYHLTDTVDDEATGIVAINLVRIKAGFAIPAIIITADNSPEIVEKAKRNNLHVLRKPVKPAALRALMTQLRVRRVAAE